MFSKSVANQNNHRVPVLANSNFGSTTSKVQYFIWMNPSEFMGLKVSEDPQNFLDDIKKILEVVQVTGNDRAELGSNQLKDVAHIWYTQWKENRGTNVDPITWGFSMESFCTGSLREI